MAPPPDDYGWAYVDAQRATASADGPSGSLQFRWGSEDLVPGQFSGSADLVFYPNSLAHNASTADTGNDDSQDLSGSSLYLYGNMYVSGAVHAETYTIRQVTSTEVQVSGSTQFGDTADDTHQRTGSLEVSGKTILSDEVHVADYIRHLGDGEDGHSDTFLRMTEDFIQFRAGSTNMVQIYGSDASGSQNYIGLNNSSNADDDGTMNDTDFFMKDGHYNAGGTPKYHFYLRGNDADVATNGSLHITASLGPITSSGEIHAARFVSNDIFTSGSVHVGGSDPLAQPDEKNDLVIGNHTGNRGMTIASTPTGVGTIRFAGNTNANDGEGWIDYSGNSRKFRLGTDGLNTRVQIDSVGTQVTGTLEVSSNATFNSDVQIRSTTNSDTPVLGLYSFSEEGANSAAELDFRRYYDSSLVTGDNLGEIRFKAGETEGFSTAANNAVTLIAEVGSIQTGTATWTDGASHPGRFGIWIADNGQSGVQRRFEIEADGRTNISGALGPLTGSGEVHVAKLVGNDLAISGSAIIGTDSSNHNVRITGSLEAMSNIITPASIYVGQRIYHHADDNTYIRFLSDEIDIYGGGIALQEMDVTDPSSGTGTIKFNKNGENLDFYVKGDGGAGGTWALHIDADGHSAVIPSVDMSGVLGPLTGSGEIHATKFVGNDLAISGSSILGTNSTDGTNVDTHVIKGNVMHTGSLGVSSNAIFGGEIHVANYIRHLGDGEDGHSDTYMVMGTDIIQLRAGSNNMMTMTSYDGSGSQNLISFNAGSNSPDTDMAMYSTDGTLAFHVRALDSLISHPQVNSSMHISAALGPVTGSGEVHVAKLVGNDLAISSSAIIGAASAEDSVQVTGSLEVMSTIRTPNSLYVGQKIYHSGDDNTYISFTSDEIDIYGGGIALQEMDVTDPSNGVGTIKFNKNGENLDFYVKGDGGGGGTWALHIDADGHNPITPSVDMSGVLGPLTGSGEIHATKLVGNDLAVSGSSIVGTAATNTHVFTGDVMLTGTHEVLGAATLTGDMQIQSQAAASDRPILGLYSHATNAANSGPELDFKRFYDSDLAAGDNLGEIRFKAGETEGYHNTNNQAVTILAEVGDNRDGTAAWVDDSSHPGRFSIYVTNQGSTSGTKRFDIQADGATNISGALGPLSSSGEIHAAGFTGNSINLSGSKVSPSLLVGANAPAQAASAGSVLAAIAGSGSSHALIVKGGLSASHDVKVEHLYTNDLYISGTAHGITVDRSNYASSSVTTKRTYSPVGFDTSGYLYVSGSSILGTAAADTHVITGHTMMTGTLEVSSDAFFNGTLHAASVLLHKDDPDTGISLYPDQVVFLVGNRTMLSLHQGTTDKVVINDGGNNVDFRVESAVSSGSLLIDGGTGDIHLGGDTFVFDQDEGALRIRPGATKRAKLLLHSRDSDQADDAEIDFLRYTDGSFAQYDNLGVMRFRGAETEDGTYYTGAAILGEVDEGEWTDGLSTAGRLAFYTTNDGATSSTQKMAIDNAGHVSMTGSLNVTGEVEVGTNIHVGQYIYHAGDPDTRIRLLGDEMILTAGDVNFINLKENSTDPDTLKVNPNSKEVDVYFYGEESSVGAADGKVALHIDSNAAGEGQPAYTTQVNISGTLGPVTGSGEVHVAKVVANDIGVSGSLVLGNTGLFKMADNTSAKILVADGTSYQEVAISGDVTFTSAGVITIDNDAVEQSMIADDAVGTSQIEDSAITNAKIDNATIRADKLDISNSTDIGAALADGDMLVVADVGSSANRKTELSRIKTYTKTDISTAGTAEASKFVLLDASKNIATLGTVGCGAITSTGASSLGSISSVGSVSGSSTLQIQGSASFGAPVDISGDLVFHAAATAGVIDIKVNDGSGADTAIRIGKNGKVTKFGDDTPSDGQYLSWDALGGKIAWSDGTTPDMSGSDAHYSSTELRTSGDLSVSGSVTFAGLQSGGYSGDGAEIKFGTDEEVKLVHDPDAGLILTRTATGDNQPVTLTLKSGETGITNSNTIGEIDFKSSDSSGGDAGLVLAQIKAVASATHNTTVNSTSLEFATATDDAAATRLELTADGELKGIEGNSSNWNINNAGTGSFAQLVINDRIIHASDTDTFVHLEPNSLKLHAGTTDQPQITITQDGVVINESSNGTCDFRVETNGEANMLFVDANADTVNFAGGIGSSGITMVTTGSMRADGHIYTEGGFYTAGDLEVNGNILVNGTHPFVSDGGDPAFATVAVGTNIVHTGDVNTKIAFTTDAIGFEAGGREFLKFTEDTQDVVRFNSANADVDFQVSTSQSSGSLLIDGNTGDVHICGDSFNFDHSEGSLLIRPGTSDQGQLILASRDGTSADDAMLTFRRYTDGSFADGDNLGLIEWRGAEDEDGNYTPAAGILAEVDESAWADGSSCAGRLRFFTTADGGNTLSAAMQLDSSQNMTTYGAATIGGDIQINGNDIKDSGGNTVLSFDGSGNIDNDVAIKSATGKLDIQSTSGESILALWGSGDAMADGDNYASIRFYGSEGDTMANNGQVGYILAETTQEGDFSYNSKLGTCIKIAVGLQDSTTVDEVLFVSGESGAGRVGIQKLEPLSPLHIKQSVNNNLGGIMLEDSGDSSDLWSIHRTNTYLKFNRSEDTGDSWSGIGYLDPASAAGLIDFTGQHRSAPTDSSTITTADIGKIVSASGAYKNLDGGTLPSIDESLPSVDLASTRNDKKVYGVVSNVEDAESPTREYSTGALVSSYDKIDENDNRLVINSLGEGAIWVCSINGNLENGDYITSCEVPGYGMLQDDDLLHNYTVAKITQDCTFDLESTEYTCQEYEHEGTTYRVALVGCTYHCG